MFHRNHKNPLFSEGVRRGRKKRREEGKHERERKRKRMGMKEKGWKGGKQNNAEVSDLKAYLTKLLNLSNLCITRLPLTSHNTPSFSTRSSVGLKEARFFE